MADITRITRVQVSTHSRPKAAGDKSVYGYYKSAVSTHSRPKAAGQSLMFDGYNESSFNSQPPEGGWI